MGTFEGHLLIGMLFVIFALYYSMITSLALLRGQKILTPPWSLREKQGHRWWQRLPVIGTAKLVFSLQFILLEFFYPPGSNRLKMIDLTDPRRPFLFKENWQHATMYGFFALSGLVDVVTQVCQAWPSLKLERAVESLACSVLVLVMVSHVAHKDIVEIHIHLLLLLPIALLGLMLAVEVWMPHQPALWVLKSWLMLVVGSWMVQLGVLIYVPPTGQPWRSDNPTDLSFIVLFFCWHLGLAVILLATVYGLCSLWLRHCSSREDARYQLCPSSEELDKLRPEAELLDKGV